MVTETQKTGYWRRNPDGTREWIEAELQPKSPKPQPELALGDVLVEPEVEEPEPVEPFPAPALPEAVELEPPSVDLKELATLFNISASRFVSSEQLTDLALPLEERVAVWKIPYEQYLTWEQARLLGFDVPEGSVVRMTPMAEGEPSFFLIAEPQTPEVDEELEKVLREVYPEMYDPTRSFGYSIDEIPAAVIEQIRYELTNNYGRFVEGLFGRVGQVAGENILKRLGVTEENILLALDHQEQEVRITTLIQDVFPDTQNIEDFGKLLEADFDLFIESMQTGGSSREKRQLLEIMGYKPEEINRIFSRQRMAVEVDGTRQLLTIDVENQAAYDARGNYVGKYNSATREFTRAPEENVAKNFWDWTMFQSRTLWEQGENFFLSVLPEIIYADIPEPTIEHGWNQDLVDYLNETNRQQRENFRWLYGQNKVEYEDWVRKHPELLAPVDYQEGAYQHPELLKDPSYYVYELANIVPFIVTATGMAIATGGVGLPAMIGMAAIMAPVEGQVVYEELINAGAPEDKAAPLAAFAGGIIGALESAGRIPLLKQASPFLFGLFKKRAASDLAKRTLFETVKKFGRNFTLIHAAEVATEVSQEVVSNAAVSIYDENRSLLDNLPDIAVKTAVATLLPAGLGAGVSVRMVKPADLSGLTDVAKKARGWLQDNKGNWYEAVREIHRGERGAIGEPEEIRPKVLTQQIWDAMPVTDRALLAKHARLEGKVGSKAWKDLTSKEQDAIRLAREEIAPTIPKAEPGAPEAGVQAAAFGVEEKVVRPLGKGELVQISMDDQLKLDQARQAVEETTEDKAAYEAQQEIVGLQVSHETDPVAQKRIWIGKDKKGRDLYRGLDFFISLKEQEFPEYFTLKQAKALYPGLTEDIYSQPGTPQYNRVPRDVALDDMTKEFGMTPDEIADRVMAIRREKRQIKALENEIKTHYSGKPLEVTTEPTTTEITTNLATTGQPKLTTKQITRTLDLFGKYVESSSVIDAWELTRELRSETRTARAESLKARAQELIVEQGMPTEEAMNQAIRETMAGELPTIRTDYLSDLTDKMRAVLFNKVYKLLKDEQFELMSTITALTNALTGKPIPRQPGPTGRSAFTRLQRVFGDQPKVLKALEKMAEEKKPLEDVVEGIFHEVGREPTPIDQEAADYLRKLLGIPFGYKTLLEPEFEAPVVTDIRTSADLEFAKAELELGRQLAEGELTFDEYQLKRMEARDKAYPVTPPPRFDPPIDKAFKQPPMFSFMEQSMLNRVLKELLWSPLDIGNFLRANKASFDNSFLRQSKALAGGHPVVGFQAHTTAWQCMFSQKHTEAEWELITRDPDFQVYDQIRQDTGHDPLRVPAFAGVKGTERWRTAEEFGFPTVERLIPRLTQKIPYIKYSERAFSAGTNKMVWGVWKQKLEWSRRYSEKIASGEVILKEGEAFDIIQEMTDHQAMLGDMIQRANLRRFSGLAPAMNAFFFAARSKIGRFLAPTHLIGITIRQGKVSFNPRIIKEAWRDFLLTNAEIAGVMFLGSWLGLWELEDDPRNAEFMSARIGNTRIDPWAGQRQFVVLYTRLVTKTGISSVTGAEYDVNPEGAVLNFITNSLSPLAAAMLEFYTGRNFIGGVIDFADKRYWIEKITPFAINDVWEATEEDWRMGVAVTIPAIYGEGVQTYTGDWEENFTKLGLPKYLENTAYGLTEPKYDTSDFWTDTSSQFKGVDPATLTAEKGFPPYIRAIAEARIINEHLNALPNEKLVNLNADPALDEPTFGEYRKMWADREKLVAAGDEAELTKRELQPDGKYKKVTYKGEDALKAFDQDERTSSAEKGNFSQRQFALLNEYWAIIDKKEQSEFLRKHKDEIGTNLRQDWLRSHLKENAQLAVWGQAKILTKEAFTEFNRLVRELDIPDSALPELTIPPETSWDTHIAYEEKVDEGAHNSVAASLLLLKDHLAAEEAGVQSYVDWRTESGNPLTLSDKQVEYLQLRVDNQRLYDDLEAAQDIAIKADRDTAVAAVRATKVGAETFHDIERRVEAMGNGTREAPIPDEVVNAFVEHMRIVDETSGNSAEAKLNRYDNSDLNEYLMNEDYHGKSAAEVLDENRQYLDNYLVPRWRIEVEYRDEDAEYDDIPEDDREARDAYLAGEGLEGAELQRRIDYRHDRRRSEALEMSNKITGERFPLDQVENFVGYYEIEIKGKRQERFLVENPEFANAMHNIAGIDIPKPEDVPAVQYDDIYDEWKDEFTKLEGLADNESKFYIEDVATRDAARQAMRFDTEGKYTAFGLAEMKRNAYGEFVPIEYTDPQAVGNPIEDYVAYYKIIGEGKPKNWKLDTGTDLWYEDDWFMMEHMDFYRDIYRDLIGNEKWDFTKVPTREVFDDYLTYIALPHLKAKDDFRWVKRELDAWLVIKFDYTPIAEKKRREDLTTRERFIEEWAERGQAIEERLKALRE